MVNTDDFVKIILAVAVAFAIVGLAFALMRFISKLTGILDEVKRPVKNIGDLSDLTLADYVQARTFVRSAFDMSNVIKHFSGIFQKRKPKEREALEDELND